jgi:hypothetical protein
VDNALSAPSKNRAAMMEAGLLGSESLFVSFDFTKVAMLDAGERYLAALRSHALTEMPDEIKTYVHELTHYIHYTTTPYGLFLQYCRLMQSRATIVVVQTLLQAGIPFKLPLLGNPPRLSGDTEDVVQQYLAIWLNVENLVATLHGQSQRRYELMQAFYADVDRVKAGKRARLPELFDLYTVFFRVQESMADMLEQINADARAAGNTIPMELTGFDRAAIRQEREGYPSHDDWSDLRLHDAMELLGNPFNVESIIESAATVAEFWGSGTGYDAFSTWANATVDPTLQVYRNCLVQGLNAIPTRQLPSFVMSYMAICELALYAPLLPNHASLRRMKPNFRQVLPVHRWMDILGAASHISPMRDPADHARYVTDICKALDWVHPIQIMKVALDGPEAVTNPLAMIYLWAQRSRAQFMGTFLGVQNYLFESSPLAETWRSQFNFVILDYADCTNYHRDKGFLQAMTTRHLNMMGMQCIMLNKSLKIKAPYRGDVAERQWMSEWLRNRFKTLFGREFRSLQFV